VLGIKVIPGELENSLPEIKFQKFKKIPKIQKKSKKI
jgi:hypothetical protein